MYSEKFFNEYAAILLYAHDDSLDKKDIKKVHTPARLLDVSTCAFIEATLHEVMSELSYDDIKTSIRVIENTAREFSYANGSSLYDLFLKHIENNKFKDRIIPEYLMPYVIARVSEIFLAPCIIDSDKLIEDRKYSDE